jgi:hypothetical protein
MTNSNQVHIGTLRLIKGEWHFVPHSLYEDILPIFKSDNPLAEKINSMTSGSDYMRVEAFKVDEFTHPELFRDIPWGLGTTCWKIIEPKDL